MRHTTSLLLALICCATTVVACSDDVPGGGGESDSGQQDRGRQGDEDAGDNQVPEDTGRTTDLTETDAWVANDTVEDAPTFDTTTAVDVGGDGGGSTGLPDVFGGDDTGESDGGDTRRMTDQGDLPYDVPTAGVVGADELGHRYLMFATSGQGVSLALESGAGLSGDVTVSGPLVEGVPSGEVDTSAFPADSAVSLDFDAPSTGYYWVTIESGAGGYQLELTCTSGCSSEVGACPDATSPVPPPLGAHLNLGADLEILVFDDESPGFVDIYTPAGAFDDTTLVSLAARDMVAVRPRPDGAEHVAVLYDDAVEVVVLSEGTTVDRVPLSGGTGIARVQWLTPGQDDLIVLDASGELSLITWGDTGPSVSSLGFDLGGVTPIDLTSGDLNRDGIRELVLVYSDDDDETFLSVIELVDDTLSRGAFLLDRGIGACGAGDMDGEFGDEIVCSHTGFFGSDDLSVYQVVDDGDTLDRLVGPWDSPGSEIVSIAVGDVDGDGVGAAYALHGGGTVRAYKMADDELERAAYFEPNATAPTLVALADADDDSPQAELLDGPVTTRTVVVPNLAVVVPPAWDGSTDYWASAGVAQSEFSETRQEQSVSLNASISIGYSGSFAQIAKIGGSVKVARTLTRTVRDQATLRQGLNFTVEAGPDDDTTGAVLLSWTCYDTYAYAIHDPTGLLGGATEQEVTVNVPRHIGRVLWGLDRYNDAAAELGLDLIAADVVAGHPESYPIRREDLFGDVLLDEDMIVNDPFVWAVSDTSRLTGFYEYSAEAWDVDRTATDFNVSLSGGAMGVSVDAAVGISGAGTHTLRVGDSVKFTFGVGPIPDNPDTPFDDYATYTYQFSPILFRQRAESGPFFALYHFVSALGPGYD